MTMHNETAMQDAAANRDTTYSFEAVNGRYHTALNNNTFEGSLNPAMGDGEDWIAIELKAGTVYTITVTGRDFDSDLTADGPDGDGDLTNDFNPLEDPILTVYDYKGGMVDMNDDKDGPKGDLTSELMITPDADGVFYIAVSAYTGNPGSMNAGDYTVTVVESDIPSPTAGETISGTAGNDKITGTDNDDILNGNDGDDVLNGGAGDDVLRGGADNTPDADTTPDTDDANDTDTIGGNDLLIGGPGSDVLFGGDGIDTISYMYSGEGIDINLMTGVARGGDAGGDSFGNPDAMEYTNDIENVQGSMHDDDITGDAMANMIWGFGGNDDLNGGDGGDTLDGGMGDDDLSGGDGDDTLKGGYGMDTLTGGKGMDTASYAGSMMGVEVRLHASKAMGGDAEGDTFGGMVTYEHMTLNEDDEMVETESTAVDIEHLTGSDMDDILAGDGRMNTIMGMGGNDKIYGGPGGDADTNEDMLHGGDGDDMIFGGVGEDTLNGDDGNDMLVGGPGQDTYDGGAGNDMIYVDLADITDATGNPINGGENADDADMPDSDTVSFERFSDEDGGVTAVTLGVGIYLNTENAIGTDFADTITGDDDSNNTIEGGAGGDTLNGGESTGDSDTLSYASSPKRVRVDFSDTTDTAVGGHATNDVITNDSFENIIGSAFDDVLTGNDEGNMLTGGDGDDELVGGDGDDTLSGGAGEDELSGGAGDDTLEGGAGADELDGGDDAATGANTLSYASSDAGVSVNLTTISVAGGHAQDDTIAVYDDVDHDGDSATDSDGDGNNLDDTDTDPIDVASFRKVTGSDHNDSITGDYRMNVLNGMGGDDTLRGGGSWDMLIGGPGEDTLYGGESGAMEDDEDTDGTDESRAEDVDWAVYRHAEGGVTVNLHTMMGEGGDAMGDVLNDIELVWGSEDMENGDTFIAGSGADMVHGDFGPDTLSYEASGMGVYVTLVGQPVWDDTDEPAGAGSSLTGAPADENAPGQGTPTGHLAAAVAMASAITVADDGTVTATALTADEGPEDNVNGAAGDRFGGIQNLTGSAHDDFLVGDAAANTLMGGAGDDFLRGNEEDDMLHGGAGEDRLMGDAGEDTLMGGDDDDTLDGGGDADTLNGGDGEDELTGGSEDDRLIGGAGDDELDGGTGDDTFVFAPGHGVDYIVGGFDDDDGDKIDLTAFDGLSTENIGMLMEDRGAAVEIDLSDHGGGRIIIQSEDLADDITTAGAGIDVTDFIFAA